MTSQKSNINISNIERLASPNRFSVKAPISTKTITNNISNFTESEQLLSNNDIIEKADQYTSTLGIWFWNFIRIFLVILILVFLGFNIFAYLGLITQDTAVFLKPLLKLLGYPVLETTKQTLKTSIEGTKDIIDITAIGANTSLDTLEKSLDGKADLMKSLNDAKDKIERKKKKNIIQKQKINGQPEPHEPSKRGKSGFCYIGEDRGVRSCIEVGEIDQCISGDIFPSKNICINPNLRM